MTTKDKPRRCSLPIISKIEFEKRLRMRPLEDLSVIKLMENFLLEKRGFVFKMPKPGSPVILLLSGGLDSIISWGLLMEKYEFQVYPIAVYNEVSRTNKEKESVNFYSHYYAKRYPSLYNPVVNITFTGGPITFPIEKAVTLFHPNVIWDYLNKFSNADDIDLGYCWFPMLPIYGKMYAEYLRRRRDFKINTIFSGIVPSDGEVLSEQTFSSMRSAMVNLCTMSGDYSWQFSSVFFEKEIHNWIEKCEAIRWSAFQNIPIERTWSCYYGLKYQCGGADCRACRARRNAFQKAKVKDFTKYKSIKEHSVIDSASERLRVSVNELLNFLS